MKTAITKGLEPAVVLEMRGMFTSSLRLRKHLQSLLQTKIDAHFKAQYARTEYDVANWAEKQADSMGYCRALAEVISLLDDGKEIVTPKKSVGRPKKAEKSPEPLV